MEIQRGKALNARAVRGHLRELSAKFPKVERLFIRRTFFRQFRELYHDSTIKTFIPLFARRGAEEEIKKALEKPEGNVNPVRTASS